MARVSLPAPYGGLNVLAGAGNIELPDALQCTNFIPRVKCIETRKGSIWEYQTGSAGYIKTIASHSNGTIVIAYDGVLRGVNSATWATVATTGVLSAVDVWQYTQFGDRLLFVNGIAAPQEWNGSAFAALTITGVTATTLVGVQTFKGRTYYWQNRARGFWYAAAGAFQGALTFFNLGQFLDSDGTLLFMVPLTIDGGSGPDDIAAFVFSNGQVLLYQGDDPGAVSAWEQIGRFRIPQPKGHKAWTIIGATTIIGTVSGPVDLQRALQLGPVDLTSTFGQQISGTVTITPDIDVTRIELLQAQDDRLLLQMTYGVDPISATEQLQEILVMDMDSRRWCLFRGWEQVATSIGLTGGQLLLGDGGHIYTYAGNGGDQVGNGFSSTVSVHYTCLSAYTDLGAPGDRKQVTAFSIGSAVPLASTTAITAVTIGAAADFVSQGALAAPTVSKTVPTTAVFNDEQWYSFNANGYDLAFGVELAGQSVTGAAVANPIRIYRFDLQVKTGGPL